MNQPSHNPLRVLLLATYEMGRQPFSLASPAAWLREAGAEVSCQDLAREKLDPAMVRNADVIAFSVPMHTATRLAVEVLARVKTINSEAHLCFYGLYAPLNEVFLRRQGVHTILGGEFEEGLVNLVRRLPAGQAMDSAAGQPEPLISLARQKFRVPDRSGLPPLSEYALLKDGKGKSQTAGYTEASRGCKHLCRHCPVVPVYQGNFRIVQRDVVLEDLRQQVAAGAEHITFGDPDFFNGVRHARDIVEALHREFPRLTYDVTIKIEHLVKHADHLPVLRDTGCLVVTSAVESVDDAVLALLDKGHTRQDFLRVVEQFRKTRITLAPTFVPFTPWITLEGYRDLLQLIAKLGLTENVAPIQLAIRLLVPSGSRLLELPEVREQVQPFNETLLTHKWAHPDPRMDRLQKDVQHCVQDGERKGLSRTEIFEQAWTLAQEAAGAAQVMPDSGAADAPPRAAVPYLNEPWYC
jgi:radical SAM superfamily enzyme YgiQ (UPF0313 family)